MSEMLSLRFGWSVFAFAKASPSSCSSPLASTRRSAQFLSAKTTLDVHVPTDEDMEDIGSLLATLVLEDDPAGSVIFLQGDLGAGKTTFSRGFVRAATGEPDLRVTSPTYLLSNTYSIASQPSIELFHMDLYRLSGSTTTEFAPLNLPHVFSSCVSLVEWPMRLPAALVPAENHRLDVTITLLRGEDAVRNVSMETARDGPWQRHLDTIRREGYLDDLLIDASM